MKINQIHISNFRILEDFKLDVEDELSLVIGKNNSGKTSILTILDKFLNQSDKNRFVFEDFNLNFIEQIKSIIEDSNSITEEDFDKAFYGIKLRILVNYSDSDNFGNIQKLMLDLDPNNNSIVLGFDYFLHYKKYLEFRTAFAEYQAKEKIKKTEADKQKKEYKEKEFKSFFKNNYDKYFESKRKSIYYNQEQKEIDESNSISIDDINLSSIISFKYISARRDVTNKDTDKTLSLQTSKIYEKKESDENESQKVEDFQDTIINTDVELSKIYESFFEDIIEKIRTLGGIKEDDSLLSVLSTLQSRELLKGNTTVYYKHDDNDLPENFNGLGYLNLISMIFEIEIKKYEFQKSKNENPADLNLLFIEEPEAHTHPQMQYVFIKNVKAIIGKEICKRIKPTIGTEIEVKKDLQTIITTHSSHIVADSDFDTIKYLRIKNKKVEAKNLKELKTQYEEGTKQYQFLKQYLTISRAEIFFADKAILIEGDTERILLPTIMKKIDIENKKTDLENKKLPLLSQNISIIEVGAYSEIFELFIAFVGIRTLIITDLDTSKKEVFKNDDGQVIKNKKGEDRYIEKACRVAQGDSFSNAALNFFFRKPSLSDIIELSFDKKILTKKSGDWTQDSDGELCLVCQTEQNGYIARSFEDSFIEINKKFISSNIGTFNGIKNSDYFEDEIDSYDLADKCIKKKTHFALDIIYNSNEDLSNWEIPAYIKNGLLWLKEN
jgi:predicted ATP-dependent endonuclease of OLD family